MTKRMIWPLLIGIAGCAILISLGVWQVQRLAWKEGVLAEIAEQIDAPAAALPDSPTEASDKYRPVEITGRFGERELHVLFSIKNVGPGYRVISAMEAEDGRRLLVDRGYIQTAAKDQPRPLEASVTVQGNLHWPDEIDGFTPEPDIASNIWFARDLPAMAEALGTEPVLVVARTTSETDPKTRPVPLTPTGIPNDHLQYAVTWFLLAVAWAGMTVYLLWRIRQRTV